MIEGNANPFSAAPPCRLSNRSCAGLETMKANTTNRQSFIILSMDKDVVAATRDTVLNPLNLTDTG
jgi:hypothetical protein